MEPRIVTKDQFMIVGMEYVGNNQQGEIPKMWDVFINRVGEIKNGKGDAFYGFMECICEGECKCGQGGAFRYIAGREVSSLDAIPEGMVGKTVPAAKYAVFTHRGSLQALMDTMDKICTKWLPEAGLTSTTEFGFEYYDERFKGFTEDSELDIYVPVE